MHLHRMRTTIEPRSPSLPWPQSNRATLCAISRQWAMRVGTAHPGERIEPLLLRGHNTARLSLCLKDHLTLIPQELKVRQPGRIAR